MPAMEGSSLQPLASPHPLVPSLSVVTDERERQGYICSVQRLWGLPRTVSHFPGANPVSLERKHIDLVTRERCMVALKSDGVRYLLVLTTNPEGAGIALMINRAMAMYEVEVWAHFDYFGEGTILDGELVWEYDNYVPRLRYVVFDAVCTMGRRHTDQPYDARMEVVSSLCASNTALFPNSEELERYILAERKVVAMRNAHDLKIVPKRCHFISGMHELWSGRKNAAHRNDGLIFTLCDAPVEINTSTSTFKLKSDHTVDVLVRREGEKALPFCYSAGRLVKLRSVAVERETYRVRMEVNEVVSPILSADQKVVECACTLLGGELILFALKVRYDKDGPNSLKTVERTVFNIVEGLTVEAIQEKMKK